MTKPYKDVIAEIHEESFTPEMKERAEAIKQAALDYEAVASQHQFLNGIPKEVREAWVKLADLCYGESDNLEIITHVNRQFLNSRKILQPQLNELAEGLELRKRITELREDMDWVMTHSITTEELSGDNQPMKGYDPVEAIANCMGKKSERPYYVLDDEYRVVANLLAATVVLAEKIMDFTDPPIMIDLQGATFTGNDHKILRWRNLRTLPWIASTDFTVDTEKLSAFMQSSFEKALPKKFVPISAKASEDLPFVILDFGESFGAVPFRYCEFKMFLEAARYIGAKTILYADAMHQLVAVKNEDDYEGEGSFVAVMPCRLSDTCEKERMFVIEM